MAGLGIVVEVLEAPSDVNLDGNSVLLLVVCGAAWNMVVDVDMDVGSVVSIDNGLNSVATNGTTDISDAIIVRGQVI